MYITLVTLPHHVSVPMGHACFFSWNIDTRQSPHNANKIELYTFVTLFLGSLTPPPTPNALHNTLMAPIVGHTVTFKTWFHFLATHTAYSFANSNCFVVDLRHAALTSLNGNYRSVLCVNSGRYCRWPFFCFILRLYSHLLSPPSPSSYPLYPPSIPHPPLNALF